MATTRRTTASFKPAVESLEERALMSGMPASPLTGYMAAMVQGSYNAAVALQAVGGWVGTSSYGHNF